jgi:hypothetical protein
VILTPWRHCKHAVLQRILRGRLVFRPHINPISGEIDGYDFRGLTRFDKLFTGLAVERPAGLVRGDTTGCEDIGPEDTFDGDYGRLLDRAYEKLMKVLASPTGIAPFRVIRGRAPGARRECYTPPPGGSPCHDAPCASHSRICRLDRTR